MTKIIELTDFSEFEALGNTWNQILQRSRDNEVFSTWEWLSCWWKHFGKERRLRVLIIENENKIMAIAPLMRSEYSFLHLGKLHKIEFIGTPHSDYNNFLLIEKETEYVKLFLNHLRKFDDWNLLELRDVCQGSMSANVFQNMSKSRSLRLNMMADTLCPYISLPTTKGEFLSRLSPNMCRNLRKRMRRLDKDHKLGFKTQHNFSSLEEAMETFFELHQKRWSSKGKPGAFASRVFRDFHLSLARIFDEKGWLALHFLTVDDTPVAAIYSFEYNNKKYGYLTGFEPDFQQYSVGNLLKKHVIEECIGKGLREYDLTRGSESYKADWATGVRKNWVVRSVHKGLFARAYKWAYQNSISLSLIGRLGENLSLKNVDARNSVPKND